MLPDRSNALPPVVFALLIINGAVFLWEQGNMQTPLLYFALWPIGSGGPSFGIWQLVSYGFLHGSLLHLFANMFALWMFGVVVENTLGSKPFGIYYAVCLIGAGVIQLVVVSLGTPPGAMPHPTVGASGAIFGILLAFGMMYPNQTVMLLFPPIPMKAKYFVILYGLFELYAAASGTMAGVANFAHLGGMAFGFALIQYWRGKLPVKPRRRLMR